MVWWHLLVTIYEGRLNVFLRWLNGGGCWVDFACLRGLFVCDSGWSWWLCIEEIVIFFICIVGCVV